MILYAENQNEVIEEHALYSQAAVLMDGETGRVLYGKNQDIPLAMASTTKIMTCIVALEQGELDDVVTVSKYASIQPKVKLYLNVGEQIELKDLLYSLMLESHNDSAVAIAEHIGAKMMGMTERAEERSHEQSQKAVKTFVSKMNEKARELQCFETWFITPNGLDGTEVFTGEDGTTLEKYHQTTAEELARIMSYCILHSPKKEEFLGITGTYHYQFNNVEQTRTFSCTNHNAFLGMMKGAISGKTGYTGRAGYCYVGALMQDDRYYVVALLNSGAFGNKMRKWADTRKLMEYGITNYKKKNIYQKIEEVSPILVKNGIAESGDYFGEAYAKVEVPYQENVELLVSEQDYIEQRLEVKKETEAPVRKGEILGNVTLYMNGNMIRQFPVVSIEKIDCKNWIFAFNFLLKKLLFAN